MIQTQFENPLCITTAFKKSTFSGMPQIQSSFHNIHPFNRKLWENHSIYRVINSSRMLLYEKQRQWWCFIEQKPDEPRRLNAALISKPPHKSLFYEPSSTEHWDFEAVRFSCVCRIYPCAFYNAFSQCRRKTDREEDKSCLWSPFNSVLFYISG